MDLTIVDVFAERRYAGNQLAVVHDARDLSTEQMQDIAREMNFSETTFVLERDDERATVRIFTPEWELPFAGHPTLGSCRAWLNAGGVPKNAEKSAGRILQECEAGPVRLRLEDDRLAFEAPPLIRSGTGEEEKREEVRRA